MRLVLFALLAACSSSATTAPPPVQNATVAPRIPTDLGSLVIVTASARTDGVPAFVPIKTPYPIVDPTAKLAANTTANVVDARGASGTFTSSAPAKIAYGCDGNQLDVTPLAGTATLSPGVAWALVDRSVRPSASAPIIVTMPAKAAYGFGDLSITVERDAKKQDHGQLRFTVNDTTVADVPFERQLMDGADASMKILDMREGGPAIPVALAAWSIDGSGHAPYLVAIERPGWEGTTLEAWLVEARSAKQLEAMTTYLYQCAF